MPPEGNAYGVRVNDGPGDDRSWRAYERPDSPEPDFEFGPSREDLSGPEVPSTWPVHAPPAAYRSLQQPVPVRSGRITDWWRRRTPLTKLVVGAVAGGLAAFGLVEVGVAGGGQPAEEAAVLEADPRFAPLAPASFRRLERAIERQLGRTTVTRVVAFKDSYAVHIHDGEDGEVYTWRGGRMLDSILAYDDGPSFDLGDVDPASIRAAALGARRGVQRPTRWWVMVEVPDGGSEPMITAQALGEGGGLGSAELDADGEPIDPQDP